MAQDQMTSDQCQASFDATNRCELSAQPTLGAANTIPLLSISDETPLTETVETALTGVSVLFT